MNNNNISKRTLKEATKKVIAFNQNYKCKGCDVILPPSFQIDHIIPFSLSQNDNDDNLQALCPNCHSLKTQRENYRISHFKKMYNINEHCWFCLEKNCNQTCSKMIRKIEFSNTSKREITSFDTMCEKLRYDNGGVEENKAILNIEICLYNRCIYVNNVICRMNKDDVTIEDIIDAVFLATRSKQYNSQYNVISIKIIPPNNYSIEELDECVKYVENMITVDDFPERIFKNDEIIVLLCFY
jgi:hypothetical protein